MLLNLLDLSVNLNERTLKLWKWRGYTACNEEVSETPSPRSDPWQRRRAGISKGKTPASAHSSMGKAIARLRVDSERSNGMSSTAVTLLPLCGCSCILQSQFAFEGSNVNLLARDYLVDMVKRMGGNAVQYPTGSEPSPLFSETLDKRK